MSAPKSEFVKVIQERGYFHQCTDLEALDALAAKGVVSGYIGFDATADSLHVGHMVQIMLLRRLQQTGHRPIALMGGGTTKVGDPSGKDESRKLLSVEDINSNLERIKQSFAGYLRFGAARSDAVMVNNADWLDKLNYIEFLRDYGRHFSVNRMLSFDSVKLRLEREHPLTFLEFNYMILQAYDFLELSRRLDCRLQMGGSDQWGNIVNGVELGRRIDNKELFGLTAPLITTASGAKMGKTAAGAVWLNQERLSAYDFWQYWRNTEDGDVGRFLKLFTDLPLAEIARLEKLQGAEINEAKIILANEATTLCHGAEAARNAAETARRTFVEGGLGEDLPVLEIGQAELSAGVAAIDLLHRAGLVASKSEARRLVKGGGARLNDAPIEDENRRITLNDLNADGVVKLSFGRKKHAVVRPK
ncbi:MAG TPA: tyrosine--tRNA ligase [Alphaproteobacteria bacterium]|nr:tyrosine--tRNA ligase [Alphaproteobacteria bacterium]